MGRGGIFTLKRNIFHKRVGSKRRENKQKQKGLIAIAFICLITIGKSKKETGSTSMLNLSLLYMS